MTDEQRIFEAQGFLILTSEKPLQVGTIIGNAGHGIGQVIVIGEATEAELAAQAERIGVRAIPSAGHY